MYLQICTVCTYVYVCSLEFQTLCSRFHVSDVITPPKPSQRTVWVWVPQTTYMYVWIIMHLPYLYTQMTLRPSPLDQINLQSITKVMYSRFEQLLCWLSCLASL